MTERLNAEMDPSSPPNKLAWEETVWVSGFQKPVAQRASVYQGVPPFDIVK